MAQVGGSFGHDYYWLVFVPVGLTPVAIRVFANYALEICEPHDHAHYVSTLNFCLALPVVIISPAVGWLISVTTFETVFLAGAAVVLAAGLLTFRLTEPRRHVTHAATEIDTEE
jgi:hypothetical protein